MKIAILKYNAGNVQSVLFALQRIGAEGFLTSDPGELRAADKVIFPGVGEASSAMAFLRQKKLDEVIRNLTRPVLGICLGMQLMCRKSEEGNAECIGIFDVPVRKFNTDLKVPQVGWNLVEERNGKLFKNIEGETYMYFVHSYYAGLSSHTSSVTRYPEKYSSSLEMNNFFAVQFHPERSGKAGETVLKNFLEL